MEHLLRELTVAQREAVLHVEGPLLILAGPGSGKTRVVTHRVAWLLQQGVPGDQILALTFTNKAAEEMRARIERLAPGGGVWMGTFHRFCARLLRKYARFVGLQQNYTIYDTDDAAIALRRAMAKLQLDPLRYPPEPIAQAISWAKSSLITHTCYEPRLGNPLGVTVKQVYPIYQEQLLACNAADFDDLLLHVATMLRENPEIRRSLDQRYRFILVDEYQDTNFAQYAIARALSIDYPNLAVTGDPDQSIYGWRGANLSNILEFERDYPSVRVVRLEQNYRSTQRILRVAAELIAHNVRRKEKNLYTENGLGVPVRLVNYPTHKDEAEDIASSIAGQVRAGRRRPRDFAIFYRTNALSRTLEFALHQQSVPYQMINGLEFLDRKEIRDVLSYVQLLSNPHDEVSLLRVINTPPRGIGKTTLARLADYATRHGQTMLAAAREARQINTLSARSAAHVLRFVEVFDRLAAVADGSIEEILGHVLTETGYQAHLQACHTPEDQERLADVQELLTVAREFDERSGGRGVLDEFLEQMCLVNDTDDWHAEADRVTLMTLHSSKGLEFPVVYVIAVEEGLLPHERSRQQEDQLEEERRLLFVGITRAQEELQLSMARYRDFRGQRKLTVPSHFLMELPREEMQLQEGDGSLWLEAEPPDVEPVFSRPEPQDGSDIFCTREPASLADKAAISASFLTARLTTAAELANGGSPLPPVAPDAFSHGMVVRHPTYGLGRIVALSGMGAQRTATVDFASSAGRKKFVLADSPLRLVKA